MTAHVWDPQFGYCERCALSRLMVVEHRLVCEVPGPAELRARRAWVAGRRAPLRRLAQQILDDLAAGR